MPAQTADAASPEVAPRHALAGLAILAGLLSRIASLAWWPAVEALTGPALWLGTALLWPDLPRRNRRQAGMLAGMGAGLLLVATVGYGARVDWSGVLDGNTQVVAMLVGVSFIGLIGNLRGRPRPPGHPVTGRRGLAGTWLGVHLLGTILNLSTVFMVGDRLARHAPLTLPQLLALNRGLSSAALWSPFFASMGIVMTLAPAMDYATVLAHGLPLALCAGLVTMLELPRRFDLSDTAGFSMSPRSLLLPVVMAALVMGFHFGLTPELSIVSIITFLMPASALVTNLTKGPRWTLGRLHRHALTRLPAMRGEISLFLCAGLLTKGLSTLANAATDGGWTLFETYGISEAMFSFLAIVVSAVAGLHPIIGVSVLASVLDLADGQQTLFAFTALAAWAVGTSVGPLSGINLSLQGRYGVSGTLMMRENLRYALVMAVLVVAMIAWLART
ncbi:hypothetical protein [Halomonas nitroreducens]|uniref:Permease n=1 Tax=Halomonas nitroreducens TaxID=447425 RepID=A0A431V4W8_9GAMM|nr:hypothetical protein [Halomonas nitroreducens]RTR05372.1 hypothetical protein EKG36_07245 [Halomonas nitroreducens]